MNPEYRLEVTNLSLLRGFRRVVKDFTVHIPAGSGFWLSGPNGAGKTTLLRALAGMLRAESGDITLYSNGQPLSPDHEDYRAQILFLPARAPVKAMLTVREQWQLWQKLFNRSADIPAELNLQNHLDHRIGKLSMGQQRRLSLALLTLARRRIWILDEAFNHLDDAGNDWLLQTLKQHIATNGIVIIAAPQLPVDDLFTHHYL